MLIAPLSVSKSLRTRQQVRVRTAPSGALLAWLAIGIGVLLLVPASRGSRLFGATLPFWLVVAPLLNLAWIERRRIALAVARSLRRLQGGTRTSRNVRAQRASRSFACNSARS